MRIESLEGKFLGLIHDERSGRQSAFWAAIAFASILVLGFMDYYTGNEFHFLIFYLVPILFATLRAGKLYGYLLSIIGAATSETAFLLAVGKKVFTPLTCWNILAQSVLFMVFVLLVHAVRTSQRHEKNAAREDGLTGLLNARGLGEVLAKEIERSRRFAHPLSIAHVACENFGQVRGKIGAALSDGVLRLVAECMQATLRGTDAVARAYDDEFVAVLTETDEKAALLAMEKLESRLAEVITQHYPELIFSIGIVSFAQCRHGHQEALDLADMALYEARRLGRIVSVSK